MHLKRINQQTNMPRRLDYSRHAQTHHTEQRIASFTRVPIASIRTGRAGWGHPLPRAQLHQTQQHHNNKTHTSQHSNLCDSPKIYADHCMVMFSVMFSTDLVDADCSGDVCLACEQGNCPRYCAGSDTTCTRRNRCGSA